jgi:hypothetical protein
MRPNGLILLYECRLPRFYDNAYPHQTPRDIRHNMSGLDAGPTGDARVGSRHFAQGRALGAVFSQGNSRMRATGQLASLRVPCADMRWFTRCVAVGRATTLRVVVTRVRSRPDGREQHSLVRS